MKQPHHTKTRRAQPSGFAVSATSLEVALLFPAVTGIVLLLLPVLAL
jgi:hypothetical protein